MPQTPDDLSKIIKEMALQQAKKRGRQIDGQALERIGQIPDIYRQQKTIDVDLGRLESMISDVIELASKNAGAVISLSAIMFSLGNVDCHYLWFC